MEKRPTKLVIPDSVPLGGDMMGGMDDMNTPMPPMDAGQDMIPPEGGDQDPMMGGEEPPMDDAGAPEGDMGGGEDDELMNLINSLSIEDKAAVKKYAESMTDDEGGEEPPMGDAGAPQDMGGEMPMESRFNFKHIIEGIFNDDGKKKSVFDVGTDRPQDKMVGKPKVKDGDNPFSPL